MSPFTHLACLTWTLFHDQSLIESSSNKNCPQRSNQSNWDIIFANACSYWLFHIMSFCNALSTTHEIPFSPLVLGGIRNIRDSGLNLNPIRHTSTHECFLLQGQSSNYWKSWWHSSTPFVRLHTYMLCLIPLVECLAFILIIHCHCNWLLLLQFVLTLSISTSHCFQSFKHLSVLHWCKHSCIHWS